VLSDAQDVQPGSGQEGVSGSIQEWDAQFNALPRKVLGEVGCKQKEVLGWGADGFDLGQVLRSMNAPDYQLEYFLPVLPPDGELSLGPAGAGRPRNDLPGQS
jgi:hypothetical protein